MIKKIKLSKQTFLVLVFAGVSILFFSFLYIPGLKKLNKIKQELSSIQKEFKEIAGLSSQTAILPKFLTALNENEGFLSEKFSHLEEETIKGVSEIGAAQGIFIISIRSSFEALNSQESSVFSSFNQKVKKACLNISAQGNYIQLGKFLENLRKEFETFVIPDKLNITKASGTDKLNIQMRLFFYLVG
ncbi:MAG: hypothetical protein ABIH08_02915 [Candidatus Omnitrophota bacterium]